MNSLTTLYSSTQPTDLSQDLRYHVGHAAGWLARGYKQASTNFPLSGRLYLAKSGWLLLSVPNALVRGVFDALTAPGAELPLAGTMNVPNVDGSVLNAHISVMTAEEVSKIGADKINERGHHFGYTLGAIREIDVKNVDGVSKVWAIQVSSPALSALRKSYGLSPLPKDQPFHITVAVRRKHVLGNNEVSKFDAAPGRGELKAAAAAKLLKDFKEKGRVVPTTAQQEQLTEFGNDVALKRYLNATKVPADLTRLAPKWKDRQHILAALPKHLSDTQTAIQTNGNVDKEMTDLALIAKAWLKSQRQKQLLAERLQKFQATAQYPSLAATNKQSAADQAALKTAGVYNFEGDVPTLAKKQLFKGEPIYAYQTVPGWNDEIKAAADLLPGGEADNVPDSAFPKSKLQEGAEHEHEHTSNDQVAKEIAKDHLSEDPRYYEHHQEQEKEVEKSAKPQILKDLLAAKDHSDNKRYEHKAEILRRLMAQSPQDWEIDDPEPKYKGITHRPTRFKFHAPPSVIPTGVKAANNQAGNSVYFDQMKNMMVSREPFVYDHNKPVFANIQAHMQKLKRRGDWILQARRNQQIYRASIDPKYRHQLALQAFHGTMPQPSYTDQLIERYGDNFLGAPK